MRFRTHLLLNLNGRIQFVIRYKYVLMIVLVLRFGKYESFDSIEYMIFYL